MFEATDALEVFCAKAVGIHPLAVDVRIADEQRSGVCMPRLDCEMQRRIPQAVCGAVSVHRRTLRVSAHAVICPHVPAARAAHG